MLEKTTDERSLLEQLLDAPEQVVKNLGIPAPTKNAIWMTYDVQVTRHTNPSTLLADVQWYIKNTTDLVFARYTYNQRKKQWERCE